jgi:hypothetical protein
MAGLAGVQKGRRVNTLSVRRTYVIEERFDRAIRSIRSALERQELTIAGEIDMSPRSDLHFGKKPGAASRLLLVDSPLLLFEALALDRAAGVFFPLHLLVSADGDQTHVSCVEAASLFDVRLPAGSSQPLADLRNRITIALESLTPQSSGRRHPGGDV